MCITALTLQCCLGILFFSEQDLNGLWAVSAKGFLAQTTVNFRQADLNTDGALDLVFAKEVLFQKDGQFPPELSTPLPKFPSPTLIDLWDNTVFACSGDTLSAYRWEEQKWTCTLEQKLEQPIQESPCDAAPAGDTDRPFTSVFQRILYDIDNDNVPEIVSVNASGLHLFTKKNGAYVLTRNIDLLPPLAMQEVPEQPLWPPAARRIGIPARAVSCHVIIESGAFSVFTQELAPENKKSYRCTQYTLEEPEKSPPPILTKPLPAFLQPCRLNRDASVDYAGGQWVEATTSILAPMMYETWATLDQGASFHIRRVPALPNFRPNASFLDFDGDSNLDLITEATGLFEGGLRETIARFMTSASMEHTLSVYPQVHGAFTEKPALLTRFTIGFEAPPFRNPPGYAQYLDAGAFSIAGDFNGDGFHDAIVKEAPDRLALYLACGFSYPAKPTITIQVPPNARFSVMDVNGDGKSDIILQWMDLQQGLGREHTRVCFAGERL